jgi:hypothetical protein
MEQNYFQFDQQCYKQTEGSAVDAPTSLILAEVCIQHFRVIPGNATNNLLRVLNLITIYLDFNSYNQSYSRHKFTSHKLHFRIFSPASSSVSTEMI